MNNNITITITTTQEKLDAVEAIVLDAQNWLQQAWEGKATNCIRRIIERDSNLNYTKLTEQEKTNEIVKIKPKKRRDIVEINHV